MTCAVRPVATFVANHLPLLYKDDRDMSFACGRCRANFGSSVKHTIIYLKIMYIYIYTLSYLTLRLFYGHIVCILRLTESNFISAASVPRSCGRIKAKISLTDNDSCCRYRR